VEESGKNRNVNRQSIGARAANDQIQFRHRGLQCRGIDGLAEVQFPKLNIQICGKADVDAVGFAKSPLQFSNFMSKFLR